MIKEALADAVRGALVALAVDPLPENIELERPARREHGDWSTNVALATAKAAGRNPRELATELVAHLEANPPAHVTGVEIAGPGFVNFRLADTWLHDVLTTVVEAGEADYARLDFGAGTKVMVEFVSANPTGPLHAGHGRGAAYGDALARVLERCGYDVERETYLNDRGSQMKNFGASLHARKTGGEIPEDGYNGEYVTEWATEMPEDADPVAWGRERAIADQRDVLGRMNISFDTWFSETSLVESGAIEETLDDLRAKNVVYDEDGATWLRSTDFGDDKDRVLVKTDGELTYLAPDIAYHRNKFARGFDQLIDVWGADHHGYVPRMKAALQALGHDADAFTVPIVQLVNLVRAGQPVRLSKRAGDIVLLSDLLDEVGPDAARLTYLLQSIDTTQTFDLDEVTKKANDNPVFYVQYANARVHSMSRVAAERGVERKPLADVDLGLLTHDREHELLRRLFELPDVLRIACNEKAPHKITSWVRELASDFHGFYHDCPVVKEDVPPELSQARLWLVESARIGLAIGLDTLGVSAPESM